MATVTVQGFFLNFFLRIGMLICLEAKISFSLIAVLTMTLVFIKLEKKMFFIPIFFTLVMPLTQ